MKNNWTEIIYEIYDFLYWEPQHIWKIKNKNSKINSVDKSLNHIKNIEVSLNQILKIFFYFLQNNIFKNFINLKWKKDYLEDNYFLYLKEIEELIEWINWATQPDFFFIWEESNIFIEMKINSKSSLEQLMKYIFLHIKDCERVWKNKKLNLIYLAKWEFKNLFKEKFNNIDELKKEFQDFEIPKITKKGNNNLEEYFEKIKEIWKNMDIDFISYLDFKNFCIKNRKSNEKLFSWIINELENRKLV